MNKKGFAALLLLLLLTLLLLAGLPYMTSRITRSRMQSAMVVTATPPPTYDDIYQ